MFFLVNRSAHVYSPAMPASKGQVCEIQITQDRWSLCAITKVNGDNTVNVIAFSDGINPWPLPSTPDGVSAATRINVANGSGVGQWREVAVSDQIVALIAAAIAGFTGFATQGYVDAGLSELEGQLQAQVSAAVDGCCIAPNAGESVAPNSMPFGAARRPNANRPVRVTASGTITIVSALLGSHSGSVTLQSDSTASPLAIRATAPAAVIGIAATLTFPWSLSYDVPAGHYYKLVTGGTANASFALSYINETVL